MVFITKNRNFNTKTRFSCRKQHFTSKIVLYSGKLSFYQENRKFYVENDVFQRKNIINAVLYWKRWFLSPKTENLTRKRGFLVENSNLHLKQYFIVENSIFIRRIEKILRRKRCFLEKNIRNAVLHWQRWFLSPKTEILTRKRGFLVENSNLHLKQYFIVENSIFIRRIENFTSKTMFSRKKYQKCRFTLVEMVFIRKNRNCNTKTRFSCRKQHFSSKIVLYSGKLSFYQENRKFYVENDVFYRKNIRNAVLYWKRWFLSPKTEILTRKRGFLVENSNLHLKQYFILQWKTQFFLDESKILLRKRYFLEKNIRNAVLHWQRWFLSPKTEILTRKRGFLVENSTLHLKQYFIVENSVFIRSIENFTSKTMFSREKILEMPFYTAKDGFYHQKQKF